MDWNKRQAITILMYLKKKYGPGWAYLSEEQKENAIFARMMRLLLMQTMEKYKPGQELIMGVAKSVEDLREKGEMQ